MTTHPCVQIDASVFMLPRLLSRHGLGARQERSMERGIIPMRREQPAPRLVEVSVSVQQQRQPLVTDVEPWGHGHRANGFWSANGCAVVALAACWQKENRQ